MQLKEFLPENTIVEVLITTRNKDNSYNTKPIGIILENNNILLRLYPNKTLNNIKHSKNFLIQFTTNPLTYTRAFFNDLAENDYDNNAVLNGATHSFSMKTVDFKEIIQEDMYGKTTITHITSEQVKCMKISNIIPVLDRSTYKIINLLIDYSRLKINDENDKLRFIKKIEETEKFINKNSNKNHKKALNLIKKEIR